MTKLFTNPNWYVTFSSIDLSASCAFSRMIDKVTLYKNTDVMFCYVAINKTKWCRNRAFFETILGATINTPRPFLENLIVGSRICINPTGGDYGIMGNNCKLVTPLLLNCLEVHGENSFVISFKFKIESEYANLKQMSKAIAVYM